VSHVESCHAVEAVDLASAWFWGFLEKKLLNARGYARKFLRSGMLYRPSESLINAASFLACTRKKIFAWGMWVFCE